MLHPEQSRATWVADHPGSLSPEGQAELWQTRCFFPRARALHFLFFSLIVTDLAENLQE